MVLVEHDITGDPEKHDAAKLRTLSMTILLSVCSPRTKEIINAR